MVVVATPQIEMRPVVGLKPYPGNARQHSKKQVRQIADSITRFGFTNPVLISDDGEIVAGHGRVMAAKELGLDAVPTLKLSHLSAEERRAYVLADNKLALNAGWDSEILAIELQALIDLDFDVTLTGFSLAEVDLALDQAREASTDGPDSPEDLISEPPETAVSRSGDLWQFTGVRGPGTENSARRSLRLSGNALSLSGKRLPLSGIGVAPRRKQAWLRGNGLPFGASFLLRSGRGMLLNEMVEHLGEIVDACSSQVAAAPRLRIFQHRQTGSVRGLDAGIGILDGEHRRWWQAKSGAANRIGARVGLAPLDVVQADRELE